MTYEQLKVGLELLFLGAFFAGFLGAFAYHAMDAFMDRAVEYIERRRHARASRAWQEMREVMKQPGASAPSAMAGARDRQGEGRKAGR